MRERMEATPRATVARRRSRFMVSLSTGLGLAFPPPLAKGLW